MLSTSTRGAWPHAFDQAIENVSQAQVPLIRLMAYKFIERELLFGNATKSRICSQMIAFPKKTIKKYMNSGLKSPKPDLRLQI